MTDSKFDLPAILASHKKWLFGEAGGSRANLSGANLYGANLSRADLSRADLSRANLSGADLSVADLSRADLSRANLSGADLYGANLSRADLSVADLSGANLSRADLSVADLSGANLSGADLSGANLSRADLSRADLYGAKFDNTPAAQLAIARTRIVGEGDLIGWKKLRNDAIAKIKIPAKAKRSHAFGRKCRAEFAKVIEIFDAQGKKLKEGISQHDSSFKYTVGKIVKPHNWEDDWKIECGGGIHFYLTKIEAENR